MKIQFGLLLQPNGLEVLTAKGDLQSGSISNIEWTREDKPELEKKLLHWAESQHPDDREHWDANQQDPNTGEYYYAVSIPGE